MYRVFIFILLAICLSGAANAPVGQTLASRNTLPRDVRPDRDEQFVAARSLKERADSLSKKWDRTAHQNSVALNLEAASTFGENSAGEIIESLRAAARSLRILGEHKKALDRLERALKAAVGPAFSNERISILSQMAMTHFQTGGFDEGRLLVQEARQLRSAGSSVTSEADYLACEAELQYYQRNLAQSETGFERVIELRRIANDKKGEAEALTSLGQLFMVGGKYEKGIEVLSSAIPLWQELGDLRGETLTTVAIGHIYAVSSRHREALETYRRAEQGFPSDLDLTERAALYNGLSVVHESYGEIELSYSNRLKALELFEKEGDLFSQLVSLPRIGQLLFYKGERDHAIVLLKKGEEIAVKLKDEYTQFLIALMLGEVFMELGRDQEAMDLFDDALAFFEKRQNYREVAMIEAGRGKILFRQDQLGQAEASLLRSRDLRRLIKDKGGESRDSYLLSRIEAKNGRHQPAMRYAEEAISIHESLYGDISNSKLQMSFSSEIASLYDHYIGLLMTKDRTGLPEDSTHLALKAAERSRSRSMINDLVLAAANFSADADPALVERQRDIQAAMNSMADRLIDLLSSQGDKEKVRKLETEMNDLHHQLEEIKSELKQKSPVYSAIKDPPQFDVVAFQRDVLDENSVLLEFSLGNDESYLWVVDKQEVGAFILPPREEIEKRVESLRELLTARQARTGEAVDVHQARIADAEQRYWPEASELAKLLLGQAAGRLHGKRLIVVPDGKLHSFPFSALPLPDTSQPMLLTNEVIYQPSAQTLTLLTRIGVEKSNVERRDLLIFSDPVFTVDDERLSGSEVTDRPQRLQADSYRFVESLSSLPRLRGSGTEASAVIDIVGRSAADSFSDFAASRDRLLSMDLSKYRVLHFATHGVVYDQRPDLSGIVLSRYNEQGQALNEFVRLQDIYGMKLNADLVVLSACDTGVGKEIKGEGVMSLNTAFLQAGTQTVLASLWKVEDGAAQKLMREFYTGIADRRLTPSQSLRQAQIALANDPRYASPFYWAAFTLQGDVNIRPEIGRGFGMLWAPAAAVPVLLIGIYLIMRRRRS